MLDIHTHLHFKDYDADRDAVIERACAAGVEKMILVGVDIESSRAAIALAEQHDFFFASIGIHPHEFNQSTAISQQRTEIVKTLKELAKHPKVVAIGECGLDYFVRNRQLTTDNSQLTTDDKQGPADEQRTGNSEQLTISDEQKAMQREGFLAQIEIAREAGLPLIIHTRPSAGTMDAYEDVYSILQSEIGNLKSAILHCYQGDIEVTKHFLELPDVYFSFAGNVTYPVKRALAGTKDDILEVVKLVPVDRLFVETDCPYLAPQAYRGTRNEPAYVVMTAAKIAIMKGIEVDDLNQSLTHRFLSLFTRTI